MVNAGFLNVWPINLRENLQGFHYRQNCTELTPKIMQFNYYQSNYLFLVKVLQIYHYSTCSTFHDSHVYYNNNSAPRLWPPPANGHMCVIAYVHNLHWLCPLQASIEGMSCPRAICLFIPGLIRRDGHSKPAL